jgi:hypothetical protein
MSSNEQNRARSLLANTDSTSRGAFQYWLRVMRWKTRNGLIGQPGLAALERGFGGSLIHKKTKAHIGYGMQRFTVRAEHVVTEQEWRQVGDAAKKNHESPIWCEILFDGEYFATSGNPRAALAYYAFASEVFMRSCFMNELPENANQNVREVIDRHVNARAILQRYIAREFRGTLKGNTISNLHQLFDRRDDIVHRGKAGNLPAEELVRFRNAARDLLFQERS